MKVVIIDYGMGNIQSIQGALKYIGVDEILVSNQESKISKADKIILPGVGSFTKAMQNIKNLGLDKILKTEVMVNKKPILGICLGMQLMTKNSTEDGFNLGLNFIDGSVDKFNFNNIKIPHVGFNQVSFNNQSKLYKDLVEPCDFYFTHSYKVDINSDVTNINLSTCDYGDNFLASYEFENIAAVQFHPELSQTNGLQLLNNFMKNF